jgi:hypothetical protein
VLPFSTETGALLAMFPDGVMQRLRVGAQAGSRSSTWRARTSRRSR